MEEIVLMVPAKKEERDVNSVDQVEIWEEGVMEISVTPEDH